MDSKTQQHQAPPVMSSAWASGQAPGGEEISIVPTATASSAAGCQAPRTSSTSNGSNAKSEHSGLEHDKVMAAIEKKLGAERRKSIVNVTPEKASSILDSKLRVHNRADEIAAGERRR